MITVVEVQCVHVMYKLNVSETILLKMQICCDSARIIGKWYVFDFEYFGLVILKSLDIFGMP